MGAMEVPLIFYSLAVKDTKRTYRSTYPITELEKTVKEKAKEKGTSRVQL
ncbi:hypothetical protein BpJC7_17050 [Weizmannia acidilactici]|uniref:Uncharacterized protein n=1 Tax=Weizmannia acidilactici TaxID=2607726 RepID=A0A5J4J632_9BACI|nr:hypothetical protein BpJC4_24490 [Weizmannia acidilactici]GER70402.1 hypothetical protein BpJC7_17050 [Weizmannia acidilactici]GER74436.1 hypothetical protein BpPP18_25030 [Weizmannia acidilactici]